MRRPDEVVRAVDVDVVADVRAVADVGPVGKIRMIRDARMIRGVQAVVPSGRVGNSGPLAGGRVAARRKGRMVGAATAAECRPSGMRLGDVRRVEILVRGAERRRVNRCRPVGAASRMVSATAMTAAASVAASTAMTTAACMASSASTMPATVATAAPARHGQARRQDDDQQESRNRLQVRIHWYFSGSFRQECANSRYLGGGGLRVIVNFFDIGRSSPRRRCDPAIATSCGPWKRG